MFLDLPPGVAQADAVAFNNRMARKDGVDRTEYDGTAHFTEEYQAVVAEVCSDLAAPFDLDVLDYRGALLDRFLAVASE